MKRLTLFVAAAALVTPVALVTQQSWAQSAAARMRPAKPVAVNAALAAAVADPRRDGDRARDIYRKPDQTLAFFQVAPEMKVGEYAPGGEWYSRLLGLYLGPKGKLVGLYFDPTSGAFNEATQTRIREGAVKYPADIAGWSGLPAERFSAYTLDAVPAGEKGTFDRILVMRMMHNLFNWNTADREIKAMRDLLKDGGMIGIEQHRAKPAAPFSFTDGSKGYLREADLIKFMEVNGFEFMGRSEANANPKDPANWPDGVWTLPPVLRGAKEEDKARLTAIGESDRMTLLFRKRP
jgi:predicted methyltransferase